MNGPSEQDFFILDAFGQMVQLFYTAELDTAPFTPPLTVYVRANSGNGWKSFEVARVRDLFLDNVDGVLE